MTPEQRLDRAEKILVRMIKSGRRSRSEFRYKINSLIDAQMRHEAIWKAESHEVNEKLKAVAIAQAELTESQKLTGKSIAELTESQKLTGKSIAGLSESQKLTDKALAELAESQKLTDKALRDFINSHHKRENGDA